MSSWIEAAEMALKNVNTSTKIPYEFEFWNEKERGKVPDTYIVYFLVSNPPISSADGKERASLPKIQVSLYYRDISVIKKIPEELITAFNAAGFRRSSTGRIPYQQNSGHYGWRSDFYYFERR